jgi:anti-sigma B factor antagonist
MDPVELTVEASDDGDRRTITLAGELDMATAGRLEEAVGAALEGAQHELVIDLSHVSFMDSTGLRAVLRARRACGDAGRELFVVPSEGGEQRHLFNVSGVIGELTFRAPPPDAAPDPPKSS